MTYTVTESKVKTVRQGDNDFMIKDGLIMYPRAMIHITPECPTDVRSKIMWAVNNGYIKTVAHMYDHELTFDKLKEI